MTLLTIYLVGSLIVSCVMILGRKRIQELASAMYRGELDFYVFVVYTAITYPIHILFFIIRLITRR